MKFLFLIISLIAFSPRVFAQKTDNQVWTDLQLIVPVKTKRNAKNIKVDQVVLNLDGITRFGRNDSFPVDDRLSAMLDFRVNKFLKLTPGYLYQRFEQIPHQRFYETRLSFAASVEKSFDHFTVRHRSMFEYRLRNFRPNTDVYRARFQTVYSLKHNRKEIFAPFVSDEPYYDLKQHLWNRNEFIIGITRKLTSKIAVDFSYIRLDTTTVDANALGATIKVKLR